MSTIPSKHIKWLFFFFLVWLCLLFALKLGYIAFSTESNTFAFIKAQELREEQPKQPEYDYLDRWIAMLAECESGSNENIINWEDGGSPSYGYLQWKESSIIYFNKKYNILPNIEDGEIMNIIMDKDVQIKFARKVIEDDGWHHWKNCAEKIGLDNVDVDQL